MWHFLIKTRYNILWNFSSDWPENFICHCTSTFTWVWTIILLFWFRSNNLKYFLLFSVYHHANYYSSSIIKFFNRKLLCFRYLFICGSALNRLFCWWGLSIFFSSPLWYPIPCKWNTNNQITTEARNVSRITRLDFSTHAHTISFHRSKMKNVQPRQRSNEN